MFHGENVKHCMQTKLITTHRSPAKGNTGCKVWQKIGKCLLYSLQIYSLKYLCNQFHILLQMKIVILIGM